MTRQMTDVLDVAFFQREYYTACKSTEQIGRELGCTGRAIRYRMAELGLATDMSRIKKANQKPASPERQFRGGRPPHKTGEDHHNWKGGRYRNSTGHILVLARDHPAANAQGYMMEHRLVMEGVLGRRLTKPELVHHINHDPGDNRPENLQVMTRAEHQWHHRRHNLRERSVAPDSAHSHV